MTNKEQLFRAAGIIPMPKHKPAPIPEKQKKSKPSDDNKDDEGKKESQADALIRIATTEAFLFHDKAKDGYASITINGHKETWPLGSRFFRQWLVRRYYEQTEKARIAKLRQALNVIEAKAIFDGPEITLNLRVAEFENALWYDLLTVLSKQLRLRMAGQWLIALRFYSDVLRTLQLRYCRNVVVVGPAKKYINLKDKEDWMLLTALIIHTYIPGIPHAIPVFYGDKGAAKTTAQRVIRKLVDPAIRDTMTLPNDKNELVLMLMTNYAPCFDNLDGLSPWQSDMLCQAATGGGISKRELYTDMDEVILSFLRCPMLNGINLVASRDDLLDRSVLFKLDRIDEENRKTEKEFWQEFETDRPLILGAISDTLTGALKIYPTVKLPVLPRMADFATWGYAIMEAAGGAGLAFLQAYRKNIAGAVEEAVTSDIIGAAVIEFMTDKDEWKGTATDLIEKLNELPSVDEKDKAWPKRPNTLTRRLNRIKSALADYGIRVNTDYRTATQRLILLQRVDNLSSLSSYRHESSNANTYTDDDIMTVDDDNENISSFWETLNNQGYDGNDANDDFFADLPQGDD